MSQFRMPRRRKDIFAQRNTVFELTGNIHGNFSIVKALQAPLPGQGK